MVTLMSMGIIGIAGCIGAVFVAYAAAAAISSPKKTNGSKKTTKKKIPRRKKTEEGSPEGSFWVDLLVKLAIFGLIGLGIFLAFRFRIFF